MYYYDEVLDNSHVNVSHTTFLHDSIPIAANVYLDPNKEKPAAGYTAIVIGHPTGGVKEQTAGVYAVKLAELGFLTLTFDAAYQGESGGSPRYLEDPAARVEDFRCALDYLLSRSDVNPDTIGVLGICASGGYAIHAAQTDIRFKAIATVSMADLGDLFQNGLQRTQTEDMKAAFRQQIAEQRTKEARGETVVYSPFVPRTAENAASMPKDYREGYEYYRNSPTAHPNAPSQFVLSRASRILDFTALSHVDALSPRPLLLIAGTEAQTRYFSEEAFEKAGPEKELYWVADATHIEMYYKTEYVDAAVNKLDEFYTAKLGK